MSRLADLETRASRLLEQAYDRAGNDPSFAKQVADALLPVYVVQVVGMTFAQQNLLR